MSEQTFTSLEFTVLKVFHKLYGTSGFPDPASFVVKARVNTGAGRYVDLEAPSAPGCVDGFLDLQGRYISMRGLPLGMQATVAVEHGHPIQLEFATFGEHSWDGVEREWEIISPA